MGCDHLAMRFSKRLQRLFCHSEHPTRPTCTVVQKIRARLDITCDWQEDQLRHQLYGIARRPVLARLFVVLLVEAPYELLEHRAHAVVVEARMLNRTICGEHRVRAQIDVWREQLLDQSSKRISLRQARNLIAELEILEYVLHV